MPDSPPDAYKYFIEGMLNFETDQEEKKWRELFEKYNVGEKYTRYKRITLEDTFSVWMQDVDLKIRSWNDKTAMFLTEEEHFAVERGITFEKGPLRLIAGTEEQTLEFYRTMGTWLKLQRNNNMAITTHVGPFWRPKDHPIWGHYRYLHPSEIDVWIDFFDLASKGHYAVVGADSAGIYCLDLDFYQLISWSFKDTVERNLRKEELILWGDMREVPENWWDILGYLHALIPQWAGKWIPEDEDAWYIYHMLGMTFFYAVGVFFDNIAKTTNWQLPFNKIELSPERWAMVYQASGRVWDHILEKEITNVAGVTVQHYGNDPALAIDILSLAWKKVITPYLMILKETHTPKPIKGDEQEFEPPDIHEKKICIPQSGKILVGPNEVTAQTLWGRASGTVRYLERGEVFVLNPKKEEIIKLAAAVNEWAYNNTEIDAAEGDFGLKESHIGIYSNPPARDIQIGNYDYIDYEPEDETTVGGYTYIDKAMTFQQDTTLSAISLATQTSGTITAMVFRQEGNNYRVIAVTNTLQAEEDDLVELEFSSPVNVQSGDIVGWYTEPNGARVNTYTAEEGSGLLQYSIMGIKITDIVPMLSFDPIPLKSKGSYNTAPSATLTSQRLIDMDTITNGRSFIDTWRVFTADNGWIRPVVVTNNAGTLYLTGVGPWTYCYGNSWNEITNRTPIEVPPNSMLGIDRKRWSATAGYDENQQADRQVMRYMIAGKIPDNILLAAFQNIGENLRISAYGTPYDWPIAETIIPFSPKAINEWYSFWSECASFVRFQISADGENWYKVNSDQASNFCYGSLQDYGRSTAQDYNETGPHWELVEIEKEYNETTGVTTSIKITVNNGCTDEIVKHVERQGLGYNDVLAGGKITSYKFFSMLEATCTRGQISKYIKDFDGTDSPRVSLFPKRIDEGQYEEPVWYPDINLEPDYENGEHAYTAEHGKQVTNKQLYVRAFLRYWGGDEPFLSDITARYRHYNVSGDNVLPEELKKQAFIDSPITIPPCVTQWKDATVTLAPRWKNKKISSEDCLAKGTLPAEDCINKGCEREIQLYDATLNFMASFNGGMTWGSDEECNNETPDCALPAIMQKVLCSEMMQDAIVFFLDLYSDGSDTPIVEKICFGYDTCIESPAEFIFGKGVDYAAAKEREGL